MIAMGGAVFGFCETALSQTQHANQVATSNWLEAVTRFRQMKVADRISVASVTGLNGLACSGGVRWKQIGPSPLTIPPANRTDGLGPDSGMVRDIAIDPRGAVDLTIYLATDNGGIWKTTDGGSTWSPKTDFMPSLNMGAVALDPANPLIVYAGTGNERNQGFTKGVGLYKSSDGGETWTILGAKILTGVAINRIAFSGAAVLLLATSSGVYRSIDGGANFGNDAPQFRNSSPTISGDVTDLDVDTAASATVYASLSGLGVFKSTDSGATFPLGGNLFTATNGAPTNSAYIAFAQSTQPNNQTMYMNVQLLSGPVNAGMFKSVDTGATWKQISVLNNDMEVCSSECGYAQVIAVDPQDANRVYIGVRSLCLATDGGASGLTAANRIDLNKVHADQHALVFSPPSHRTGPAPTHLFTGTDGGLATTADSGGNWKPLNGSDDCAGPNTALATMLFRQIDIGRGSASNNRYTYGASQDLGVSSHRADCPGTSWVLGLGGDGNTVAVDPRDPTHAIAEDGGFSLSNSDGKAWTQPQVGLPAAIPTLLYFDPNGGTAYAVVNNNQIYRSSDSGASFSLMATLAPTGVGITAMNIAKIDSNTLWLGRGDGTVSHTSNASAGASATWLPASIKGAPTAQPVSGIAIDPFNTAQIVAVYPSGQAFMTPDSGKTWLDISGDLPNLPLRAVVIDPNSSPHTIIVASDAGVLQTGNYGASREVLGVGLPTVQCTSLAIDIGVVPSLLRVGTYGRSAWELDYDRKYLDGRNFGVQDGSLERPFRTIRQALDAPGSGGTRFINIQAGDYPESPLFVAQCAYLNAVNGAVHIH